MSPQTGSFYEFGPFRMDVANRSLLRDGEVVSLTPKSFDVLLMLVENCGRALEKSEMMKRVWPDSFVEEANLSYQVFALRKALGEDGDNKYIETVPRRGYRFAAPVVALNGESSEFYLEEHTTEHILIQEETRPGADVSHIIPAAEATPPGDQLQSRPDIVRLNRRSIKMGLLVAVLLLAGGVFGLLKLSRGGAHSSSKRMMKITRLTSRGTIGDPTISPDGKFVAYSENDDVGSGCLWLRQVSSDAEVQVMPPGKRAYGGKAFSRDGTIIYFVVVDESDMKGALYQVSVLGGPATRLLRNISSAFTLSPDGKRVTFFRDDPDNQRKHLMIAALDGTDELQVLTRSYSEPGFAGFPAWSPDGTMIAFGTSTRDQPGVTILGIDIKTVAIKPLTVERWSGIGRMVWRGDGRELIFIAYRELGGNQLWSLSSDGDVRLVTNDLENYGDYGLGITADASALVVDTWERSTQIWVVGADGDTRNAESVTNGIQDGVRGLTCFPDGRIVYATRIGEDFDLWRMNIDGTGLKQLTADPGLEWNVTATSDGRYLVFASNRAGRWHVFRADADGSNLQQLTNGTGFENFPDCSPDGQWVVYSSKAGDKNMLWKVPIDGGDPVQLTDYESSRPHYSPDGKFIACLLRDANPFVGGRIGIVAAEGGIPLKLYTPKQYADLDLGFRWTPDGKSVTYVAQSKSVRNVWKQPADGSSAVQITDFKTGLIYNWVFSRDGKRIVLSRGHLSVDVLLFTDFKQ